MNEGVYIFVVNGIPKDMSPAIQRLTVWVWNGAAASAIMVAPIEFIFRYFLVVRYSLFCKKHSPLIDHLQGRHFASLAASRNGRSRCSDGVRRLHVPLPGCRQRARSQRDLRSAYVSSGVEGRKRTYSVVLRRG